MNTCISRCRVECVRQYGNDVWCVSTLVGVALCAVIFAEKVSFLLRSVKVVLWQCIYGSMYDHEMNGSHKSRGGWHLWKTASLRLRLERFGPAVPWLVTVRGGLLAPEWPRDPCPTISWRLNAFWSTSSARRRSLSILSYLLRGVAVGFPTLLLPSVAYYIRYTGCPALCLRETAPIYDWGAPRSLRATTHPARDRCDGHRSLASRRVCWRTRARRTSLHAPRASREWASCGSMHGDGASAARH
jgi:hypothetical protein